MSENDPKVWFILETTPPLVRSTQSSAFFSPFKNRVPSSHPSTFLFTCFLIFFSPKHLYVLGEKLRDLATNLSYSISPIFNTIVVDLCWSNTLGESKWGNDECSHGFHTCLWRSNNLRRNTKGRLWALRKAKCDLGLFVKMLFN